MSVKLLTEHYCEFLSLKGGCTGSSECTLIKMPQCLKSHITAQIYYGSCLFSETLSCRGLDQYLTRYDVKRLELYSQNMVDYHLIMDLVPLIARMYFLDQINVHLSAIQSVS